MTVRTRGIFGISTTVGFRGFSSSSLYLAGTEICWAPVKEHLQRACARNRLRNPPQHNHAGSPLSSTRQESINFLQGLISADNSEIFFGRRASSGRSFIAALGTSVFEASPKRCVSRGAH